MLTFIKVFINRPFIQRVMRLYPVLAQGPCMTGLLGVVPARPPILWSGPSRSPFIILTCRRDPINHNTSFANVTSLCRTPPRREPQLSYSGWVDIKDSSLYLTNPQQVFQAPGIGPRGLLSVEGSLQLSCKVSFRKLSGSGSRPTPPEGCKIPGPLPVVSSEFYFFFV